MNLYQSGVFAYEKQKLTLGNLSKKGDYGEGHEIVKKNRRLEPNSEMTGKPSLSPEQPSRCLCIKNTYLSYQGTSAVWKQWHRLHTCSIAEAEQGTLITVLSSCTYQRGINLQKESGTTLKGIWNSYQPAQSQTSITNLTQIAIAITI